MKTDDQKVKLYTGLGIMIVASVAVIGCSGPLYSSLSKIGRVQNTESIYTPGTYEAEAQGFGGAVKAQVVVDEANMTELTLTGEGETPELGGEALKKLGPAFAEAGSADVDGVAGCTVTSEAAKKAVQAALDQAK